jgi:excinuclease UvrABC ATPase subunit
MGRVDGFFANQEDKGSLLDLGEEADRAEREEKEKIAGLVREIEERLATLKKIEKERNEVLKDLKEKVSFLVEMQCEILTLSRFKLMMFRTYSF